MSAMQRGKVIFWKRDTKNARGDLFGWGFVLPDGAAESNRAARVWFCEMALRYSPVRTGDVVEFELSTKQVEGRRPAAHAVRKVESNEP